MTVAELIAELQQLPQDAQVRHAACDDYSDSPDVVADHNPRDHSVTIGREW